MMEYCIASLLDQGITSVPQWGEGHPGEEEDELLERSTSSSSWASAEGWMNYYCYYTLCE